MTTGTLRRLRKQTKRLQVENKRFKVEINFLQNEYERLEEEPGSSFPIFIKFYSNLNIFNY